ncbi:sigma 54-interacting transcriptional regulator [Pedobacter sp. ISL-68]|uniref:sigma-54-dependent Fis family transcriptional regulator n=1 Tax=unclassified Pedobacter TaxID=2628915 RepID=UPI001BE99B2B|nr:MULTISPECIES: sigma 54-interacting transcriptional regulator [unclassified Pedobacter]MBT2560267.1 sigma 54-interacting transcriptional regulator [Pedobacter sp. ISL-64]MBT2589247.1 sigma 54-interacting transcriptional regulator [Pedobacter sp. ISL-68]
MPFPVFPQMITINHYNTLQQDVPNIQVILLSLSQELALVQEKKHLVNTLETRLREFLRFESSTIFLVNDDLTTISDFLYEKSPNLNAWPFIQEIKLGRVPLDDRIVRGEVVDSSAVVLDLDEMAETRETFPYLKAGSNNSFAEVILFNLKRGPEVIGNWILTFTSKSDSERHQLPLLQIIANMINSAVLNIAVQEQLFKAQSQYDTIQAISADLSATKQRTDLLKIIHQKLKHLFDFSHHFVSVINDDDLTVTSFLRDSESRTKNHPSYNSVNTTKYPITDGFFNKAVLSNEPVVFDLMQIRKKSGLPYYLEINYESGIRTIIMTALKIREKTIGIWSICQLENQQISTAQLDLIRSLSVQFSIAIANIRGADLIQTRETEQTRLLQLSYDLTSIRKKEYLADKVSEHLKYLLEFDDLDIMLSFDKNTYANYLTTRAGVKDNPQSGEVCDVNDPCYSVVMESISPVVFETGRMVLAKDCPNYLKEDLQRGIIAKIGVSLYDDQNRIGMLMINFKQPVNYSDHTLQLIQGVAYQVSNALSNVLSYDKITRRETERDTLIQLSRHIAAVRTNKELLELITQVMKTIIGFRHTFIAKLDATGHTATGFLLDPNAAGRNHPLYHKSSTGIHELKDGFLNSAIESEEPLVVHLDEESQKNSFPLYMKVNYESGIKQLVIVRLTTNNKPFGLWIVLFDHDKKIAEATLRIISGIASQLSVAVQNIIANTNTEEKGEEKSRLIDFSNAITAVKDKHSLAGVISTQFFELFKVSNFVFLIKNPDDNTFTLFLSDKTITESSNAFLPSAEELESISDEALLKAALESSGPEILDYESLQPLAKSVLSSSGDKLSPAEKWFLAPVRIGAEFIGIMLVKTLSHDIVDNLNELFSSVCTQIAVVVSNIIAGGKIQQQLEEISGYKSRLEEEKIYLQEELETANNYSDIIGESTQMKQVFKLVSKVASSDSTVMILGETGTGKELIARAIHSNSPRSNKLMVKVNCATLPANLIESELFGHERGSFTGAMDRRLGKFELAHKGTLFLDEIGEMPLELQVKLLRALQEKEIERIGGKETIKVDVRIIAATNRNLEKEMDEGRFRSDLYYRLNIFPIELPPLRQRVEDIPLLAIHFINRFSKKMGKQINKLNNRLIQELKLYHWPGNIRELEHLIERSVLLSSGDTLKNIAIPVARNNNFDESVYIYKTLDQNERDHILMTLKACGGKINGTAGAAHVLGVPASTLSSKMKRLGITREHINNN